jgi:predicted Kef-type K+ transport protein
MIVTVYIAIAFLLGLGVRYIGLPPLVGYLIAGFGLNAYGINDGDLLEHVADIGVLLLLFSVGLKLRLKSLARLEVLAGGLLHMAVSILFVMALAVYGAGLSLLSAGVIAVALSFSSTVVAAKVLEQKKELRAFHGRVAIGILIVQDLVAVAFLSFASGQTPSPWAAVVLLLLVPLVRKLIHRLLDVSGHDELLVLYGMLLALVVGGAGFHLVGLSPELGALILGVILAEHPRAKELVTALWGLKEVFLVGFFLQIGMAGVPTWEMLGYALLLTLLLPLKFVLFFFILIVFRLRARSAFLSGLGLATFSEFGLIVGHVAAENGWLPNDWLVLMAITVAISFALAAPLNRVAHNLYDRFGVRLQRYESAKRHPDDEPISCGSANLLVMGMGRVGTGAYDYLTELQQRVVGLDSDPGKVERHRKQGRRVLYADAEDPGFWQNLRLDNVEAILLAMPELEANMIAVTQLRKRGFDGHISAVGVFPEHVAAFIEAGANVAFNYYDQAGAGFAERVWAVLDKESAGKEKPGTDLA